MLPPGGVGGLDLQGNSCLSGHCSSTWVHLLWLLQGEGKRVLSDDRCWDWTLCTQNTCSLLSLRCHLGWLGSQDLPPSVPQQKSVPRRKCAACKIVVHAPCIEQLEKVRVAARPFVPSPRMLNFP